MFLNRTKLFDELVLGSDIIQKPIVKYDEGRGNFEHPSCDYCYVYDEDDDNLFDPSSVLEAGEIDKNNLQPLARGEKVIYQYRRSSLVPLSSRSRSIQ